MFKVFAMTLLVLISTVASAVEIITADLNDLSGKEKKFTCETRREYTADSMNFTSTYKDLQGNIAVEEKGQITAGTLVRYEIQRKQTNDSGVIEVQDKKITFKYFDGKSQKADKTEPLQPETLVSANLIPYLQGHFSNIMAKEEVKFKYAVWYRQETVGFKFTYEKEEGNSVIVRMSPTNMLYRSLVDPIFITLDKTTHTATHYKGRTVPKIEVDGKWKDFDSLITYHIQAEPVPEPVKPVVEKPATKKSKKK